MLKNVKLTISKSTVSNPGISVTYLSFILLYYKGSEHCQKKSELAPPRNCLVLGCLLFVLFLFVFFSFYLHRSVSKDTSINVIVDQYVA